MYRIGHNYTVCGSMLPGKNSGLFYRNIYASVHKVEVDRGHPHTRNTLYSPMIVPSTVDDVVYIIII